MDRKELIEALEKAESPDRILDIEIWRLIRTQRASNRNAPNYTGSIDAALTLVPEGCSFELARYTDCRAYFNMWRPNTIPATNANAPTLPISICLAALRAREF